MARIPWTKFQDFYLRLGFLKVLVAALNPERRSAFNEAIIRRLETPLFDPAPKHPKLWSGIQEKVTWYPRKTPAGKVIETPEVAESILVAGESASLLYGITRDTAYKILDWGHHVDFVGRGNQITERALLLRHLLPKDNAEAFLAGDASAWDPFQLDVRERLLFLYHLVEIDKVTVELISDLGRLPEDKLLESSDAARMTCRALFRVLNDAEAALEPRDIPGFRIAKELACTIATELDLEEFRDDCRASVTGRVPRPMKQSARRATLLNSRSGTKARKTTKNADHQTVPRFEQLVDLGFLSKPVEEPGDEAAVLAGRKRWRYRPTHACRRWATAIEGQAATPFQWHHFAASSVAAFCPGPSTQSPPPAEVIARYLWRAYEQVHRPMGHTPFDSIALFGMVTAASEGVVVEMADFHRLALSIKQKGALSEHAFFSSGNDLDKMFILLKPGFYERLLELGNISTIPT